MKPLYLTTPVRAALGPCLRPGGESLTRQIVKRLSPAADQLVLDAGCGTGATMAMLREHGVRRVVGLDLEPGLLAEARQRGGAVARSDLSALPLASGGVDMIVCECTWNLTEKERVLAEFARVLRLGGVLALSDIYLRSEPADGCRPAWPIRSCFSRATDLDTVSRMVTTAGFQLLALEDHSRLLKQTAAEFVFAHGSLHGFWQAVLGDAGMAEVACAASAATRPGLFLLIAKRCSS